MGTEGVDLGGRGRGEERDSRLRAEEVGERGERVVLLLLLLRRLLLALL